MLVMDIVGSSEWHWVSVDKSVAYPNNPKYLARNDVTIWPCSIVHTKLLHFDVESVWHLAHDGVGFLLLLLNGLSSRSPILKMWIQRYPLIEHSYWKWPSRNSFFLPIYKMLIFHSYVNVCRRVYPIINHY